MRILIVEDEKKIQDFLKKSLESECFAVDISSDGKEGLGLARINEYDILVLDNVLPNLTGPDICKTLRDEGDKTPILMLSVRDEIDAKVAAINDGADDYLSKPFSFDELMARLRALLRRPQEYTGDVLEIGDLVLDTRRHLVSRNNTEITLTRKEIMLLEYLMRNRGTVLSRGMILEHVWDMNADPFSNTIESHVRSLRKKIGDTKDNSQLIHTISGRGYKIDF